jgi:hypothetical protein
MKVTHQREAKRRRASGSIQQASCLLGNLNSWLAAQPKSRIAEDPSLETIQMQLNDLFPPDGFHGPLGEAYELIGYCYMPGSPSNPEDDVEGPDCCPLCKGPYTVSNKKAGVLTAKKGKVKAV